MAKAGISLTDKDDPSGAARRLSTQWRVMDRIRVGLQRDGKVVPCPPEVIKKGDWVDVRASFDIMTFRKGNAQRVEVRLKPLTVIQLLSHAEVSTVMPRDIDDFADDGFTFDDESGGGMEL